MQQQIRLPFAEILVFVGLIYAHGCSPKPNAVPKNEFGLQVVDNIQTHRYVVKTDSTQKMMLLTAIIPDLVTDWRYATTNNFTGMVLYTQPDPFLRLPAARALQLVQADLISKGLGLKLFDAYRPYAVTRKMWAKVPDERYAANPAKGSGHNRGAAVDVTLIDLKTGKELAMPTPYDDFTEKAHHDYSRLDSTVLANRALLKSTMEKFGFAALSTEWWHYYWPNAAQRFMLMDLSFDQLRKAEQ
jgi:D-alanyl-D-alanine dipeptidase